MTSSRRRRGQDLAWQMVGTAHAVKPVMIAALACLGDKRSVKLEHVSLRVADRMLPVAVHDSLEHGLNKGFSDWRVLQGVAESAPREAVEPNQGH